MSFIPDNLAQRILEGSSDAILVSDVSGATYFRFFCRRGAWKVHGFHHPGASSSPTLGRLEKSDGDRHKSL